MAHSDSTPTTAAQSSRPAPGAFVRDSEEAEVMVLLEQTDERAGECEIPELDNRTVAAVNNCNPAETVARAAYVSTLNYRLEEWTPEEVVAMHENGTLEEQLVTVYSFPESRIEAIDTEGV